MALFSDCSTFKVHDDYYTPEYAWKNIDHLIPPATIVWEACMLNAVKSKSPQYLQSLSNVSHVYYDTQLDMLKEEHGNYDMIITNIPFSTELKKNILRRLVEIDKPFIIIMNGMNMFSKYMRDIFKDKLKDLQVINPCNKIQYDKLENGVLHPTKNCSFYSVYLAYKMNLTPDQLWLI